LKGRGEVKGGRNFPEVTTVFVKKTKVQGVQGVLMALSIQ